MRALYDATQASGHELLLEVIPPKHPNLPQGPNVVYRALKRLYNIGIYPEWWKLEPMDAAQWRNVDALIAERDPHCRGVVLLGLSAGVEQLNDGFGRGGALVDVAAASRWAARSFTSRAMRGLRGEIGDDELIARAAPHLRNADRIVARGA